MCSRLTNLCCDLIEEHFGKIVSNVGRCIIQNGWVPLRGITQSTNLKSDLVRKSLCVLIQHKLVAFHLYKGNIVEYRCDIDHVLKMILYPKMIHTAKLLYGDIAELIIEEVLHHGMILMSSVIKLVIERTNMEKKDVNIRNKAVTAFDQLVNTHFLMREPMLMHSEEDSASVPVVPSFEHEEKYMYTVPILTEASLKRKHIKSDADEPKAKRPKTEGVSPSSGLCDTSLSEDAGIYWSVNLDRFSQYFRDQGIVSAVSNRFGAGCGEIVRAMLRISEVTTAATALRTEPITPAEVARNLPLGTQMSVKHIEQHLRLVANDDSRMLEQVGESGSLGAYVINLKKCARTLATGTVLSYVQERFGSKCCRIFRLLLLKQHLEQKQVEELAMIPSKEAKGHLYQMLSENFLVMQEIPRTPDHAPSRTFYLYGVDLQRVSRMLLVRSYKTLSNLIQRRKFCTKQNKRLLEKQNRVAAIKESLQNADASQLEEIEDIISASEQAQLSKFGHCNDKLLTAQLQVMNTVFITQSYLDSLLVDKQLPK